MKRSILSAGEFMIQSNDEKSEEEAFKREENVSRRASEQIRHEGNAVVQNNICSNFEIQRNNIESGIQGNVYNSPVTYCAENRPQKDGRHRKFKPASIVMSEIKQAGLKVPFLPTGMQSEIYQNNTVGCNELQLNCCNNTREEQVTCSGGKRSSGIDRRRKFNPTSVVNFETEHDGPKVLFPPRRLHSDVFPSNTAGCNDFQRKDHESSCNNMQEKLVTCNGEKRPSGIEQHRELIPALLPVFEIHQSGLKVPFPPFNYQPDIQRNNITASNESKRKGHETSCYNTTEEQVSHIASWNETQRPKEDHRSSCINTHDYLVICNGENRTNGIARRRKFNPSSVPVAILDSEQAGLKVPFPPRSIQSNIFHSNKAHRNEFQRKDHQTSSYDTHEQVQNRPSGIARCRKFNPTSVVSCETQQAAGFQEPFQSRRMQSDIFENNATGCNVFQRNDHQASFNNTHEEQVASNGGNRPSGIARRRKFNPASVVSYETEQACFQVPFSPRRMQSYDFENNATDCNEFQRKDHQASSYDIHEEQVASNEENRPSGIARHRKYNPTFVVSCKTEQAGFHVPFPPRRMQSDVFGNATGSNDFQRKGNKSSCNKIGVDLVTCNGEKRTSGIARSRKFNSASVAVFETQPAGLKVQFLPRREQSDVVPNDSSAVCLVHQRKDHEASYNSGNEGQVTYISEHNASGIKRHTTINSAPVASEQARLPFLPSLNDRPRHHTSGRTPRIAVCTGAESAALESERRRARVFLRRFGDLNVTAPDAIQVEERHESPRIAVCTGAESAALESERRRARVFLKRFGDLNITESPYNQQ